MQGVGSPTTASILGEGSLTSDVTCDDPSHLGGASLKFDSTLIAGAPSAQHPQVQKLLWTGHKENELRMPAAEGRCDLVRAKRQAWEHDVADSPWLTSSRLAADTAAMGGAGASCKRQGCRCGRSRQGPTMP